MPNRLLVIDENQGFYEAFFTYTAWTKVEMPKQGPLLAQGARFPAFKEEFATLLTGCAAALIDYSWLIAQQEQWPAELRQAECHCIVVGSGNYLEECKWAMENGASGYIPKEYFIGYERARGEILSIIAQYRLPGVSFRPATALGAEYLINHFLQQPDVCFPYWTHFFGQDANEVFTPDALEMLKEAKTSELGDCIRIALMRARETNDKTVSTRHLPERFSINVPPARKAELEEISAMRSFLNAVNTLLEIEKSVKQVALKMRITEPELKMKLREYRQKYPDIHIKGDFQHIYRAFPLNLAAYWGTKLPVVFLVTDFLNTYLNVLSNDFFFGEPEDGDSTLSDKTRGFWTPHLVDHIDVFLFFLCKDSILDTEGTDVIAKAFARQQKSNHLPMVIGIQVQECLSNFVLRYGNHILLPEDGTPLLTLDDFYTQYRHMVEHIRERFLGIWPV